MKFNRESGAFETTSYLNVEPSGTEFMITNEEAYLVYMKVGKIVSSLISFSNGSN